MATLTLVIGNKNYSSWSLRPWLLMKRLDIPFNEVVITLDTPTTREDIERFSPSGRVPVLRQGELCVWDSLAICEYLAELTGKGWPAAREARAVARSVCAEMHPASPTCARCGHERPRPQPPYRADGGAGADIGRIDEIWNDCRARFGSGGPWLFGEYTIADAMYAPVVLRFNTYGASISQTARWYMASVLEDAPLQEWLQGARRESWTNPASEVG